MRGKQSGPNSRGKYEESKPNTRSTRTGWSKTRIRFIWCDHNLKTSKMPSPLKVAARKATGRHKLCNSSTHGGCNFRPGRSKGMFSSIGGRDGQSSVKAEPGGRNRGSAAALGGQVSAGTPPEPRRPSSKVHLRSDVR
ncbi:hypothetical protein XENORESO_012638 [Xenotaenia resolanae]|uniref:Uncharacterized protein n=1 Tax=Xenotaenia resolanae TaxID=208358 RepID=A0ABV0X4P2_9TELE